MKKHVTAVAKYLNGYYNVELPGEKAVVVVIKLFHSTFRLLLR